MLSRDVSTLEGFQGLAQDFHGPLRVRVVGVDPLSHAPELHHLLVGMSESRGWMVVGSGPLQKLVCLQTLLDTIAEDLVPQLLDDPLKSDAVRELRRCGWAVHHIGRSVGFGQEIHRSARRLGNFLRRHAGHAVRGTRSVAWMKENLDDIRHFHVPHFQNQAVVLPTVATE